MVSAFGGHEVSLSQANLLKDDPAYDEESPPDKWFHPSDSAKDEPVEELPSRLKLFRKYCYMAYDRRGWGRLFNLIMYICYILVAALVQADNATANPNDVPHAGTVGLALYVIWIVLCALHTAFSCFSIHQTFAWAGLYKSTLYALLLVGTLNMMIQSFKNIVWGTMQVEYLLLIFMAAVSLLSFY